MADEVGLEVERTDSYTVLSATGYLDVSTSPRLRERIHELVAGEKPRVLFLDLGAIEFLDSSALGVILNGWKLMHAEGATLAIVSPQPRITKIFEITALNLSMGIYASLDEARADLGLAGS
ncbi:MAG TPA: STAS domain-containing protein [Acidimicrobiales bacterium]|nr:STAS domain-containing protein [Acidimicrobiales bacterium]